MVAWVEKVGKYRVERLPLAGWAAMPTVRGVGLHGTDGFDVDTAHAWQIETDNVSLSSSRTRNPARPALRRRFRSGSDPAATRGPRSVRWG
jgi:hypothetical protein